MALTTAPVELITLDDGVTITVDDNSDTLTIVSTDADDACGPFLNLHRNSSSPADNDGTGVITFAGENDNNEEIDYAQIQTASTDVSDGSEDGTFIIQTMVAGTSRDRINLSPSETAVNDNSVDLDFRVESDSQTHALFVDSGANTVSFNQVGVINAASYFSLQTNTSDGSDNKQVALDAGAGAGSTSRGSFFAVYGNEHASQAGQIYGQTGASGKWVFATGSGASSRMEINSDGHVTMPAQPAFCVAKTSTQSNIAVNSAVTITWQSERFDQGSDFSSNTFTAPVTGKYQFNATLRLLELDTAANYMQVFLITSNQSYEIFLLDPGRFSADVDYFSFTGSALVDMDASDTAYLSVTQSGGTAQLDIGGGTDSYFSGYLVA